MLSLSTNATAASCDSRIRASTTDISNIKNSSNSKYNTDNQHDNNSKKKKSNKHARRQRRASDCGLHHQDQHNQIMTLNSLTRCASPDPTSDEISLQSGTIASKHNHRGISPLSVHLSDLPRHSISGGLVPQQHKRAPSPLLAISRSGSPVGVGRSSSPVPNIGRCSPLLIAQSSSHSNSRCVSPSPSTRQLVLEGSSSDPRRCATPTQISSTPTSHFRPITPNFLPLSSICSSSPQDLGGPPSRGSIPEIFISDDYHEHPGSSDSSTHSFENFLHILDGDRGR